jgi:protein-S-isoprenylcysteine O-methyltransferase Ste14
MKANLITLAVAFAVLAFAIVHLWGQRWMPMRIAGAAIGLPSLVLLALARLQLGASFSLGAKAQALVTYGLYSRIRNPIYILSIPTIAGMFLFFNKPRLLWTLVVVIPLQIYRARQEEQVLASTFGDEYRAYKARTWF